MSTDPRADLSWLLDTFVTETPGVTHAQTMSSDGMHLAASSGMDETTCDQFAAISSGLASLGDSAREAFGHEPVVRMIVENGDGWIIIGRVSPLASIAVVAGAGADLGLVAYEMALLVQKAGVYMSPANIRAMQNSLAI